VRLLLAALLTLGLVAAPARASWHAPCRPDAPEGAKCTWWAAKVLAVSDGDTFTARIQGRRAAVDVRFTGINAMELTRYSHRASLRRGACHGVEAASLVGAYVRRSRGRVRLAAEDPGSRSGHRIRRSVWVRDHGRWRDLAAIELETGLALWLPNKTEAAHNMEYEELAIAALKDRVGLYDPATCGAGPDDDLPLSLRVNWDADGEDGENLNGEYVEIRNDGARPMSLAGWWFRDSALRKRHGVPGYPFPAGAVLPAHGSVVLHVGCGTDSAGVFYWCQHESVFENVDRTRGAGDGGYLFDPQGDLRAARLFPCVGTCHDPLKGLVDLSVDPYGDHEQITLTNRGAAAIDLGDHVLKLRRRGVPGRYAVSHPFPRGSVIAPGRSLTLNPTGGHALPDLLGVLELKTDDDILVACDAWGIPASCPGDPPPVTIVTPAYSCDGLGMVQTVIGAPCLPPAER
jgi:endonuclease YncB( thermonuclease family)